MLCILTAIVAGSGPAQLPSGVELLDRCQRAYDAVRSLEVDISTKSDALTANTHLSFVRPGKLRATGKGLAGPKFDLLITPSEMWLYHVGWMKQETVDSAIGGVSGVSGQTASWLPPLLLNSKWGNLMAIKKYPIQVAKEQVGGRDVYRLKATGPNTTMSVWLDARTHYLVRIVKDVFGGQQDIRFNPPKVNQPIPANRFVRT